MPPPPNGRTHSKLPGTPDYDDASFWDHKFATGQDIGEWLNSGDALLEAVTSHLETRPPQESPARPRVVHLGPGVSKLGEKLREEFVHRNWAPAGIVNVDFSAEAVRLGREVESEDDPSHAMNWVQADLRSWSDVSSLGRFAPFDVVLDKSTSDAIATASDVDVLPSEDSTRVCPTVREVVSEKQEASTFSPVELLALHLAGLTAAGATWISLSYSTMRFDNRPHMGKYWNLVSRTPLKAPQGQASSFAYTPEVFHWIYVLERK